MNKIVLAISLFIICISCSSQKSIQEQLSYTGPYYVTFTIFPKNSHSMIMGGIGNTIDIESLKKNNLHDFTESFYRQLAYFPMFIDDFNYREIVNCLGYDITWHIKHPNTPMFSDLIKIKKLRLKDGNYVNIKTYRTLRNLDVKYLEDFENCITPTSIELNINKIEAIDKVGILLDKK